MSGAITLNLAGWLLAAGVWLLPVALAGAAEMPVASQQKVLTGPAGPSGSADSSKASASEPFNLYEDGDRPGAAEKRPAAQKSSALSMIARVGFWLGLVIALICGAVALARKVMPRTAAWGQSQTAELVGRTFLESKRCVYLLKVGNRVLVVGSAENGLSSLGEITERTEVDYIACLARGRLAQESGRKSDFSKLLGSRLSRLVGLTREGEDQIVEDGDLAADAMAAESTEAVGATAGPGGMQSLKEQLARLKRIS